MAENPNAGVVPEEEEDNLEYDSDGNPIAPSKKIIDPLPPIDHSEVKRCLLSLMLISVEVNIIPVNIRQSDYTCSDTCVSH